MSTSKSDEQKEIARLRAALAASEERYESLMSGRISGIGTFLAGVAHAINNPLTSIKSFAELLLLDDRPADDREALEIMEREAHRASRIIADLRIAVRQTGGRAGSQIDLNALLNEVLQVNREPGSLGGSQSASLVQKPLRVLVVDDEAPIRQTLLRYLERRGHEVVEAAEGGEALRHLETAGASGDFDVIVADLYMPGLGGADLLKKLRERGGGWESKLIFITGDAENPALLQGTGSEDIPIVLKPFELAEIAQVIEAQAAYAG